MSELARMVSDLIEKTKAGKLQWEEPDFNEFEASLSSYKLFMKPSVLGYSLTLFNSEGRPIDTFEEVRPIPFGDPPPMPLSDLFELVKRRARRVDESLAEVERMLKAL